ncbi:MAG: hypothetical protein P8013_00080 [Candidatus Sulfobium sp.]
MKKILLAAFLIILMAGTRGYAESGDSTAVDPAGGQTVSSAESGHAYTFPVFEPHGSFFGGYTFTDSNDSPNAGEFEFLHDSVSLGAGLSGFDFPHRYHLDLDFRNRKDYFADIGYAYKDIVLFRGIDRTLYHNLENITLDYGTDTSVPPSSLLEDAYFARDAGVNYGVKTSMNDLFLRLKAPNYPFHLFADGNLVYKDGTEQQRSLLGAGYFNSRLRVSQSRRVDLATENFTVGANGHFGPVEIEITHGEKRFNVGEGKVLYDRYLTAMEGDEIVRPGGLYPHNQFSELKGSSNTVRIHTSYTGALVASATFSKIDRENRDSGAKQDYFIGAGEVTWTAATNLAIFVKYRHKENDEDTPSFVTITDVSDPSNFTTYEVEPAISSITDNVSGSARYRAFPGGTFWAEYSYNRIRREHADAWDLPESTERHIASLSTALRIVRNLNLKAKYTYMAYSSPAYNIEPDHSNQGRLSVSWIPLPQINALVSYDLAKEKRHDLEVDVPTYYLDGTPQNRDVTRDKVLGVVTFLLSRNLSLSTSYAYIHNKVEQDIVYHLADFALGVPAVLDRGVPYADFARSYSANFNYTPHRRLSLNSGIAYTISEGRFTPSSADLLQPESIASFSDIKVRETVASFSGSYDLKSGFALNLDYKYTYFDDVYDNPFDDIEDGRAHIVLISLSKNF